MTNVIASFGGLVGRGFGGDALPASIPRVYNLAFSLEGREVIENGLLRHTQPLRDFFRRCSPFLKFG